MLNDLLIVSKIKEGDIKAFEKIFKLYYMPLCIYATSITGSQSIAEEIVQDIFYIIWKEKEKLNLFYSLKSYLYKAVKNKALQYCEHCEIKERHREAVLTAQTGKADSTPQETMEYEELKELIDRTLDKLPERRRRIFSMNRFEGKKYSEIASQLSISIKTVEAEMTKALQILRKEVENYTYSR